MFVKCLVLFICVIPLYSEFLDAYGVYRTVIPGNCSYPRLDHGRIRVRQRARLVKFLCLGGYELVGNKYATCRDGTWDVPLPVCVKPGCSSLSHIENGMQIPLRKNAWVIFFCMPGYRLEGSSVIFCDGKRWNDTLPTCVDATAPPSLSCNFESPTLCGWVQDELHDFDWRRLNRKTPSSFLFTGPSYDHTYGEGGLGYYMYIESTSQRQNDTARLLSPIYDASIAKDGCFTFYYHMFGRATGGLRVYQKPESYPLQSLLELEAPEISKYLLFEKWGNQGNAWYGAVAKLTYFADNFQIVIEGIRGSSFTSDIAIDDVAVLQGANCTIFDEATPGTEIVASCVGRCDAEVPVEAGCGCSTSCVVNADCCADYADTCLFPLDTTVAEMPPKTEKLIGSLPTVTESVTNRTSTTPSVPTRRTSRTTTRTVATTKIITQSTTPPSTTPTTRTKMPATSSTIRIKPLILKISDTTTAATTTTQKPSMIVVKFPITTKATTVEVMKYNTTSIVVTSRAIPIGINLTSSVIPKWTPTYTSISNLTTWSWTPRTTGKPVKDTRITSSSNNVAIIVVVTLLAVFVSGTVVIFARSARGRLVVERFRRQNGANSEVRYLTRHEDED